MTFELGRNIRSLGAIALLVGTAAYAEEKVEVMTEVVLASNQGTAVEPPSLATMKDKFRKEGFVFTSFRQLKSQKLVLVKNRPAEVRMPNNKIVTLKLEELSNGVAKIRAQLPPIDTLYSLGREGKVFIDGGHEPNGTYIFVLSPTEEARHHRFHVSVPRPIRNLLSFRAN